MLLNMVKGNKTDFIIRLLSIIVWLSLRVPAHTNLAIWGGFTGGRTEEIQSVRVQKVQRITQQPGASKSGPLLTPLALRKHVGEPGLERTDKAQQDKSLTAAVFWIGAVIGL